MIKGESRDFYKLGVFLISFFLSSIFTPEVHALHDEAEVVSGEATISHVDDHTVNITAANNSIIQYNSFNIPQNHSVNFIQPSVDAFSLNRVVGGTPSLIDGTLTANGNLIFVNTYGIHFGPTANVQVGGLIASTRDIRNEDFLSGKYIFGSTDQAVQSAFSSLLNEGSIVSRDGGFAVLIGSAVANEGLVSAPLGTAALASGDVVTVGVGEGGKISIGIDAPTSEQVLDFQGNPITDQIKQSGEMNANGGTAILHAKSALGLFDHAVNQTGIIRAEKVVEKDGVIEIVGGGNLGNTIKGGDIHLKKDGAGAAYNQLPGSTVETSGDVHIEEGVTVHADNAIYKVGGDWINHGIFDPGTSTVEFVDAIQPSYILGDNTFYNFISTTPAKDLYFEAGATQTVLGDITIQGAYAQLIEIRSTDHGGEQWRLDPKGTVSVKYVHLGDAWNLRPEPIKALPSNSFGNNTGWDTDPIWTGGAAAGNQNWSTTGNWDTGVVPGGADTVTFDGITGSNPDKNSIVDTSFAGTISNLTIQSGYAGTITLARSLTINSNYNQSGGTFNSSTLVLDINGSYTLSAGTFTATSGTMTVAGALTISGGTFNHNNGTVTLDGGTVANINPGSAVFNNLTHGTSTTKTLVSNVTVNGTFTEGGGLFSSDTARTMFLGGNYQHNTGSFGSNITIEFNGTSAQTINMPNGHTLSNPVKVNKIAGSVMLGTLWLNIFNMSSTGTLTVTQGNFDANAKQTSIGGLVTVNGGTYSASTATQTFNGGLTISSGTFLGSTGAVDVNGAVTISAAGQLTAPLGAFTVSGNWSKTGGTFNGGTGTVNFDGTNQTISGSTTFNHLTKTVTAAATLTFTAGTTQTIAGTLTLQGASGQLLSLRSDSPGTQWRIDPQGGRSIQFLNVQDSNNINASPINAVGTNSVDAGNNTGWSFVSGITISGNAFTNAGVTAIADGVTIKLVKNGTETATTTTTGGTGSYSFSSVTLSAGDDLFVFIDNNATQGNTVTEALDGSTNITGLNIHGATVIVRHESAGPVSNTVLFNAKNAYVDADVLFVVASNNLSVNSGIGLTVWTGKTYTPGGQILLQGSGGNLTIQSTATLNAEANQITVSGNFANSGTFNAGTSTVIFNAGSGTQTLNSGGSSFSNISHTGAGTLQLVTSDLTVTAGFTNSAGTFDLNLKNWTMTGATFSNDGTVITYGDIIVITGLTPDIDSGTWRYKGRNLSENLQVKEFGATDYFNLVIDDPNVTKANFVLPFGAALSVAGTFEVTNGTGFSGNAKTVNVTGLTTISGGGNYSTGGVNNTFGGGLTMTSGSFNGGGGVIDINGNVTISGGTFTASSSAYTVAGNWTQTAGTFTRGTSTLTFDGTGTQTWNSGGAQLGPVTYSGTGTLQLTANLQMTGGSMTINSGGVFDLNGFDWIMSSAPFSNDGTLRMKGTETLTDLAMDTNSGTVEYSGTNTGVTTAVKDFGVTDYFNLKFNDVNATPDTFNLGATTVASTLTLSSGVLASGASTVTTNVFTVNGGTFNGGAGGFTVTGGTSNFTAGTTNLPAGTYSEAGDFNISGTAVVNQSGPIDITGAFNQTGGTFNDSAENTNVAGNFTHTGGTFSADQGTVILDGASQTISGSTTFYRFTKTLGAAPSRTLTFTAGTTQTITNTLTLQGFDASNLLLLRSSTPGVQWNIDPQGTRTISFVDVQDSNNINATSISPTNSVNSGNNTGWAFGVTVSGNAFTDLGVTALANGVTIQLAKNGALVANVLTTGGTGTFSFSAVTLSGGDALLVYIDNNATQGNTVTLAADGTSNITGLNIYGSSAIGRHESAGPVTNASFNTAKGALADADILYSVTAGNLTVNSGIGLIVWTGKTFTPGGNVTTQGGTGHVTIQSTGTLSGGANTITVSGNFSNSGTFTAGTSIVDFNAGTGTQTLNSGGSSFATLTHSGAGTLQLVSNALTVTTALNNNAGTFDLNGQNWTMTGAPLSNAGTIRSKNTEVITGLTTNDTDSGTWLFVGDGDSAADTFNLIDFGVTDYFNLTINTTDSVDIIQATAAPTIAGALAITSGKLSLNGNNLNVTGAFSNTGTLRIIGSETFNFGTNDTDSGTWEYVGNANAGADTFTLHDFGPTDFFNLTLNATDGAQDTFSSAAAKVIQGTFTLTAGTYSPGANATTVNGLATLNVNGGVFNGGAGDLDVNGNVTISGGTLTAPSGNFTVSGNWSKTGGTFTSGTATVTFDGAGAQTLNSGGVDDGSDFFNLTVSKSADTLSLLTNAIDVDGTLRVTSGEFSHGSLAVTAVNLTVDGGTFTGGGGAVDVNGPVTLSLGTLTAPSGNFTVSGNWAKTGGTFTPGTNTVTFDSAGTQTLNSGGTGFYRLTHSGSGTLQLVTNALAVTNALTNSAGILELNGQNWTMTGATFSNDATVQLIGSETITGLTPDTNSGIFKYVGNGNALADNYTVHDFGLTDFYQLILNPADSDDSFSSAADKRIMGEMTLTSGIYNANGKSTRVFGLMRIQGGTYQASTASQFFFTGVTVTSGTFTGGSGNVSNFGDFTLSGGVFTAPTATFTSWGNFTHTAGGTFTHNSGTINFSGGVLTIDVATTETFNNVIINMGENHFNIASGDNLIVTGTLTLTSGKIAGGGTIEVQSGMTHGAGFKGGSGMINITGAAARTITLTAGGFLPAITLNAANVIVNTTGTGTVTWDWTFDLQAGTVNQGTVNFTWRGNNFTQSGGTFNGGNATMDLARSFTLSGGTFNGPNSLLVSRDFTHTAGGTFNHNSGTVTFKGAGGTINVAASETFNNLTINKDVDAVIEAAAGDTLTVIGTLTLTNGSLGGGGLIDVTGELVHQNTFDGGSFGRIQISGTGTRTINLAGGGKLPGIILDAANVTMNGPGAGTTTVDGEFKLLAGTFTGGAGNLDVDGPLNLQGGSFTAPSGTMFISRLFTVTSGATFSHNSGTVTFDGESSDINVANTITFNNLTINKNQALIIDPSDTLEVSGTLSLLSGYLAHSVINLQGGLTHGAAFTGGHTTINITGAGVRTMNLTAGGKLPPVTLNAANVTMVGPSSGTTTFQGRLTLQAGTFTGAAGNIEIKDTFKQTGGAFTAPSGTFSVTGDFERTGGTFAHNTGTVNLTGTDQTVLGATTFFNFTKTVTTASTLRFEAGVRQTIAGALTIQGAEGALLSLRSTSRAVQWEMDVQGTSTTSYLDIRDSNNVSASAISGGVGSVNSGNNLRWNFS